MPENQLPDARIPDLPVLLTPQSGMSLVIYDDVENLTKRLDISKVLAASPSSNYKYISTFAYAENAIVDYSGKWYLSLQGANQGNSPSAPGSLFWEEKEASGSGFVMYAAGIFAQDIVFVLKEVVGSIQLFSLNPTTPRPFNSTDFNTEFAAGTWVLASELGFLAFNKAAHGFALGNALTYKSGAWNKADDDADDTLAVVVLVIDVDNVIVKLTLDLLKGLSGLTAGSKYYRQADGSTSTTVSDNPVFVAISTTAAVLLAPGGGSGGAAATQADVTIANGVTALDMAAGDIQFLTITEAKVINSIINPSIKTVGFVIPGTFSVTFTTINATVTGSYNAGEQNIIWVTCIDATGTPEYSIVYENSLASGGAPDDATDTVKGIVELATSAEAVTGTDTVRAVTPAGLKAAIDALISGAPGALDTLNELAAALADDASFATTVTAALANKASLTGAETLTNKRLTPRIQSVASSATVTPNADADDGVKITAQAAGLTLANPSGTPTAMQAMIIRIKDNGVARTISYGSQYRAVGIALPATTVISKTIYLGMIWNAEETKWDVIGYSLEA